MRERRAGRREGGRAHLPVDQLAEDGRPAKPLHRLGLQHVAGPEGHNRREGGREGGRERGREEEGAHLLISWLKIGAQPNPSTGCDSNTLPVPKETTASMGTLGYRI